MGGSNEEPEERAREPSVAEEAAELAAELADESYFGPPDREHPPGFEERVAHYVREAEKLPNSPYEEELIDHEDRKNR